MLSGAAIAAAGPGAASAAGTLPGAGLAPAVNVPRPPERRVRPASRAGERRVPVRRD